TTRTSATGAERPRRAVDPMRGQSRAPHEPSTRGFTIVEIILVLVILGLLVSMVAPGVNNVTRAKLKAASTSLAGAIRYTYARAAFEHAYYRLTFEVGANKYKIERAEGEGRL